MEKYTMFMDRKNQYSEHEYTTQSNLQIQCNPYQATSGIFHRTRTNNFTICIEIMCIFKLNMHFYFQFTGAESSYKHGFRLTEQHTYQTTFH